MKRDFFIISIFALVIIAITFFLSFTQTNALWGINLWAFHSIQFRLLFLVFGAVVCIKFFNRRIAEIIEHIWNSNYVHKLNKYFLFFIISLCAVLIFYIFRTKTFFLGDGYLLINNVETVTGFRYEDILGYVLPSVLYKLFNPVFRWSSTDVFIFLSITCGFLYVFFSFLIADKLPVKTHIKIFVFFTLLLIGTIQNFFGYVELYAVSIVLTLIFFYSGALVIEGKNRLYLPAAVLSLALCFHPSNIILAPSLLYLFYLENKRKYNSKLLYFAGAFLSSVFPFILVLILLALFTDFSPAKIYHSYTESTHLLPITVQSGSINISYGLFSLFHFRDFFNKLLLLVPQAIFILPVLFLKRKEETEIPGTYFNFIGISLFFFLLFIFLFHFEIGASRDWDLVSNAGIPLALFTVLVIINRTDNTKNIALIVITYSFICVASWIGINADFNKSLKRFLYLTEDKSWSSHSKGVAFDELRSFYFKREEYRTSYFYAKKAAQIIDSPRYMINWATCAYKAGNLEEALSVYKNTTIIYPDFYDAYVKYIVTLLRIGRYSEALDILNKAEDKFGYAEFYILEGSLYEKLKEYDKAEENYKKGIEINPDRVEGYIKYGSFLMNTGKQQEALNLLSGAEQKFKNAEIYYQIAQTYKDLNNFRQAEENYKKAIAISPDYFNAYLGYSSLLIKFRKVDSALMLLEQAKYRFQRPEIYFNESLILAQLRRYDEAIENIKKVLEMNPNDVKALQLLKEYEQHLKR